MERIRDHALIGNCRSAALVSKTGTIDWLCWPRFDSPSIFGALLDEQAGRWTLAPAGARSTSRRYLDGTNVLETRFETTSGVLVVTDFMPVASDEEKRVLLLGDHEIVRIARCESGDVDVETVFDARPDYAGREPTVRDAGKLGIRVETADALLVLRTDLSHRSLDGAVVRGRHRLRAGDQVHLSLTFTDDCIAVLPPVGDWTSAALERTIRWWRRWVAQLRYDGPAHEAVVRSALALRLMVYAPSGAVVAAPTTSLPERLGGDLNWDYRFCWLRDASMTVRALFGLGYPEEASAFVSWLLHTTRITRPQLRVLYDVFGNLPRVERILDHFSGYFGSRPVRVGNAAADQLQLDVYGEVIDATTQFVRQGGELDREMQRMLLDFGRYVCCHWNQPDDGIWEPRSGRGHNSHSRVLCWTALDRLMELARKGHLPDAPLERFERNRDLIRRELVERAWNPAIGSYASRLDGDELDATLLLLAWYGFEDAGSARMRATYARVTERLGAGNGLLYRYRRPESAGEGAFGICSFWGAEYLALGGGSVEAAEALFEQLCRHANDVGLFAEEIDPATGEAMGNFPQAFTHVGLINAALTLSRRRKGHQSPLGEVVPRRAERVEGRS
jgi:GH15 family glucan-1,4-alpha-glucosidase